MSSYSSSNPKYNNEPENEYNTSPLNILTHQMYHGSLELVCAHGEDRSGVLTAGFPGPMAINILCSP